MKSKLIYLFSLVLVVFVFFGCTPSSRREIKIIHTKGARLMYNYNKSTELFVSHSLEDSTSGIALQDGDLLFVVPSDISNKEMFFQYSDRLGKDLYFKCNSLEPYKININNELFGINLQDSASWNWIKNKTMDSLSGLYYVSLSLPLKNNELNSLTGLAKIRPNLNFSIEGIQEVKQVEKILSLFQPNWLILSIDNSVQITDNLLMKLGKINSLNLIFDSESRINQFSRLKNINNILLVSSVPKSAVIDLKNFNKLGTLSLGLKQFESTRNIILPDNIVNLFFMACDSLKDIRSLSSHTQLQSLGFNDCNKLQDIRAIKGMKNLTWLSCPPSIEQEQFDSLIPTLPSLQVLELVHCDSLTNIDVLKNVKGLKSLTMSAKNIDISSLYAMNNLELLVIESDTGAIGKKQMLQLKKQLPNTLVVPGGGFCLGSGWILLIIPMVLLIIFILGRFRHTPNRFNS
jgi:hypothetical protein